MFTLRNRRSRIGNQCNAMVISWIVNNVNKELVSGVLFCSNASIVWRDLKERFDKVNMSRIYYLQGNCNIGTRRFSCCCLFFKIEGSMG